VSDPTLNAIASRVARLASAHPVGTEVRAHLAKAVQLILDADEALEREGEDKPGRAA
jgi:hypothetical protein